MPLAQRRYTPEEYLTLERASSTRSEYVNGRINAMTGASENHNQIAGNIYTQLRLLLRGKPCRAYMSEMRVKVSPTGLYTYPDVVAVCGERHREDSHFDTLLNPSLIVEVLSDSTEKYDRGEKFAHYRRLESLREYVLVAQNRVLVERYVRQGDLWVFSDISDPDGSLALNSVGCTIQMRDVYEMVEFPSPES